MQSDPIGLAGGLNTYGYVFSNPIRLVDSLGLSPEDVSAIINQFNSTVNNMTASGKRISPGFLNNMQRSLHDVTGRMLGEGYKSCGEQSTQLQSDLDFQKYDDQWRFSTIPSPNAWCIRGHCTHWVTQALSNNSTDPVIILDPWSNKWSATYGQ